MIQYFLKYLMTLLVCLFVSSESVKGDDVADLLLSGSDDILYKYAMSTGVLTPILIDDKEQKTSYGFSHLSKISNDSVLFQSKDMSIGIFDLKRNQKEILFENSTCPVYFEGVGEFAFFRNERTGDSYETKLYFSNVLKKHAFVDATLGQYLSDKCPVKINASEALVYLHDGNSMFVGHIDAVSKKVVRWKGPECNPVYGVGNDKLLCVKDGDYFIYDMTGGEILTVKESYLNKSMIPYAFLHRQNKIVIQEYRERLFLGTKINVWMLDLADMSLTLLLEDFFVENGGVIELQ